MYNNKIPVTLDLPPDHKRYFINNGIKQELYFYVFNPMILRNHLISFFIIKLQVLNYIK